MWIESENGCVITCSECGERLELCYPDGTEVRRLPHCPWCGATEEKIKESSVKPIKIIEERYDWQSNGEIGKLQGKKVFIKEVPLRTKIIINN